MTTADAFRRAIWQERGNDDLRTALADWLWDHGGEEYGEFVRVQIELAIRQFCRCVIKPDRRVWCRRCKGKPATHALRDRERELWLAHRADWGRFDGRGPLHDACNQLSWWRRGFVYMVECNWNDWTRWHGPILDAAPLERVVLTTEPEYRFRREDGLCQFVGSDKTHWIPQGERYDHSRRGVIEMMLGMEWPRLTFDLSLVRQSH